MSQVLGYLESGTSDKDVHGINNFLPVSVIHSEARQIFTR